ncbi:hypothetical protein [Chryseobacterium aahli]|nr:hypothetical protein [Chryseobacterium aahli]
MKTQNKSKSLSKVPRDGLYPEIKALLSVKLFTSTAVILSADN